jgi:hypothetical protein
MPYVYLIHCRASVNIKENVYKFGKTEDFSKRLCGYDKGSIPLFLLYVNDIDSFEKEILVLFSTKFKKRDDYGSEYFEGNIDEMIDLIIKYYNFNKTQVYNQIKIESPTNSFGTKEDNIENIIKEKNKLKAKLNKYTDKNIDEKGLQMNIQRMNLSGEFKTNWGSLLYSNLGYSDINMFKFSKCKKFGDYFDGQLEIIVRNAFMSSVDYETKQDALKIIKKIKVL